MEHLNSFILAGGLCLVALGLLAVELFIPSHGVLTIFALLFALGGVVVAYLASPLAGLLLGILVLISSPFAVYWAIKLYPNTAVGKKVMLGKPELDPPTGYAPQARALAELVGQRGIAVSTLRPSGLCEIAGQRVDSLSESGLIDAGTPVEVVQVLGMKVIVRQVPPTT
ncbi:MAG: NfeD family protein [Phycisphaerae bacterium]